MSGGRALFGMSPGCYQSWQLPHPQGVCQELGWHQERAVGTPGWDLHQQMAFRVAECLTEVTGHLGTQRTPPCLWGAAAAFLVVAFVCISHHCVSVSDLFCAWQGKSRNVCQATVLPQGWEFCKEKAQNDLDFSIFTSGNVCTLFLLSPLTYGTF